MFCSSSGRPNTTTSLELYNAFLEKLKNVFWSQHKIFDFGSSLVFAPLKTCRNCPPKKDKFKSAKHSLCQLVYFQTKTFSKNLISSKVKSFLSKKDCNLTSSKSCSEANTPLALPPRQSSKTCCILGKTSKTLAFDFSKLDNKMSK